MSKRKPQLSARLCSLFWVRSCLLRQEVSSEPSRICGETGWSLNSRTTNRLNATGQDLPRGAIEIIAVMSISGHSSALDTFNLATKCPQRSYEDAVQQ